MKPVKNRLQELYQGMGMTIPRYLTTQIGEQLFISEVVLPDGKKYKGKRCSSKKKAQNSAAERYFSIDKVREPRDKPYKIVYESYSSSSESVEFVEESSYSEELYCSEKNKLDYLIIIDIENISNREGYYDLENFQDNSKIIGIGSENFTGWKNIEPYVHEFIETPSDRKNAADVHICYYLGRHHNDLHNYNEIIILSRDKFSSALVDIMKSEFNIRKVISSSRI